MSDTDADRAQWSIKGLEIEARDIAIRAAKKRGVQIAAWIAPAIRNQANLEAGELVILPSDRLVVQPASPAEVVAMLQASAAFMQAGAAARAAGIAINARAISRAATAGEAVLRRYQGLLPIAERKPHGRQLTVHKAAAE